MKPNTEPQKWRETIDPFSLPLKTVHLLEILGYPHAGNQVFHLRGLHEGAEGYFYLKYAHNPDTKFCREIQLLQQLASPLLPKLLEYDTEYFRYMLTEQIEGKRLSVLLAESGTESGLTYMHEYGHTLALLHQIQGDFPAAPCRKFHDLPDKSYCIQLGLNTVYDWLLSNRPKKPYRCFIHGDFHYANLLWQDGHISGILDWELAGMGNREFDIAWALILRPDQQFLRSETERQAFLAGYTSAGDCDQALVRYYMVLIYTRFLTFGDEAYKTWVRQWLLEVTA